MKELDLYINPENYEEIYEWCKTNFGPESEETWKIMTNNAIGGRIFFASDTDAMAFKLRWF